MAAQFASTRDDALQTEIAQLCFETTRGSAPARRFSRYFPVVVECSSACCLLPPQISALSTTVTTTIHHYCHRSESYWRSFSPLTPKVQEGQREGIGVVG